MIEKDSIYAMLTTEPFFKTFTPRAVADAKSDREVDDLVAKATAIWELLHMRSEPR